VKLWAPFTFMMLVAASDTPAAKDQFSLSDVHAARDKYKNCLVKQAARLDDRRSEPSSISEGARSACKIDRELFVVVMSMWLSDDHPEIGEQEALRRAERLGVRYDAAVKPDVIRSVLEHRTVKKRVR
jgi:hypothetical protein